MLSYDIRCTNGHEDEIAFDKISTALETVDCATCAQCDSPVEIVVLPQKNGKGMAFIYNSGGFYGAVPTVEAHAVGLV